MDLVKACSKALVVAKPKGTIGPKKKKVTVLDEEKYTEEVEKIIEQDFFPDLTKMKAQSEYFEALEKNDLVKLRQLQMRYSKRPDTGRSIASTPSTFETPEHGERQTLGKSRPDTGQLPGVTSDTDKETKDTNNKDGKQHLDGFLSKNTSEDNDSFVTLLQESDEKQREKHAWLFENEDSRTKDEADRLALPSMEEQAAITNGKVDTWKYKTRNSVMYIPDGEDYSAAELLELVKAKPRKILYDNTRFKTNPWNNHKNKEVLKQAATENAQLHSGKIGHDGRQVQVGDTPKVNGYGFVATPSPAPGVEESPLMTWGEIEGTPFQLEANETPLEPTSGPAFKMPAVPKRDRLGIELAEKASRQHRDKKETALKLASRLASPVLKFGMSQTDRINSLSPAAQKLIGSRIGVRKHTDKALRASYTPSPRTPLGGRTPTLSPRLTPKSQRKMQSSRRVAPGNTPSSTPGSSTPGSSTPGSTRDESCTPSLTDNLLQIPKKRKKAADFF